VRKNWGGLYTVSAKLSSKVGDIHPRLAISHIK